MKVTRIEKGKYNWRIIIKDFEKNDFKKMLVIIKNLGYFRNIVEEKKMRNMSIEGYKKLAKKDSNFFIAQLKIIKQHIHLALSASKNGIYKNKDNNITFYYNPKGKIISITLVGKKLNGKKFVGLFK